MTSEKSSGNCLNSNAWSTTRSTARLGEGVSRGQELHDEEYGEWLTKEEKFHLDNAKACHWTLQLS